jgi:hypothetical protein
LRAIVAAELLLAFVRGWCSSSSGGRRTWFRRSAKRWLSSIEDFGFDAAVASPGQPGEIGAVIAFLLSNSVLSSPDRPSTPTAGPKYTFGGSGRG